MLEGLEPRLMLTTYGPLLTFADWNQSGTVVAESAGAEGGGTGGDGAGSGTISNVQWNQFTPIDPSTGTHSLTGCVATAVAQLAYYWQYPQHLVLGNANSYISGLNQPTPVNIDADAVAGDFPDFATLNTALGSISYNAVDPQQVATQEAMLSFAVGVIEHSNFSAADTTTACCSGTLAAIGFQSAADSADWASIQSTVAANIAAGEPALLVLGDGTPGDSHVVIADGYDDATQSFHLRFGWGGEFDGWYTASNFSAAGFSQVNSVVYDIRPTLPPPDQVNAIQSGKTVQLSWEASTDAIVYQVWRSKTADPAKAVRIDSPVTANSGAGQSNGRPQTTFDDPSVTSGKTYYYWIKSENGFGTPGSDFGEAIPITVTHAPTHLVFVQPPKEMTAGGASGAVTVQILDASGHVVTWDNARVMLSMKSRPETGHGPVLDPVILQAVGGVVTFGGLSLTDAGKYVLQASSEGLKSGTWKLTVLADVASSQLSLVGETDGMSTAQGVAGGWLSPALVVQVVDAYGNRIKHGSSQVTLAIVEGPEGGMLLGKTTRTIQSGQATFRKTGLSLAGLYTLSFIDLSLVESALEFSQTILPTVGPLG